MKDFEEWLIKRKTCPELSMVISSRLKYWRSQQRNAGPIRTKFKGLQAALVQQDKIGWGAAFEGRWSKKWVNVQDTYYKYIESKLSGKRWMVEIIKKLWDIAWDLWKDRNRVNAVLKTARLKAELQAKVQEEFDRGYNNLHNKHLQLFTKYSFEDRKTFRNQSNVSWLLRVKSARRHADNHPMTEDDRKKQQERERKKVLAAQRKRIQQQTERMSTLLKDWLGKRA
jgi:hypothetical protein